MRRNTRIIKLSTAAAQRSLLAQTEKRLIDSSRRNMAAIENDKRKSAHVVAAQKRLARKALGDDDEDWHQREGRLALAKLNKQNSVYHARLAACKEVLRDLEELPADALLHAYPESIRHHGVAVIHDAVYFLKYERNAALKEAALKRII